MAVVNHRDAGCNGLLVHDSGVISRSGWMVMLGTQVYRIPALVRQESGSLDLQLTEGADMNISTWDGKHQGIFQDGNISLKSLANGPGAWERHLRFARRLVFLFTATVSLPALATPITPSDPAIGTGVVYRVVDGDTFVVNLDEPALFQRFISAANGDRGRMRYLDQRNSSIRVRLANINTPESVHSNAAQNTADGKAISLTVKRMIEGKPVTVLCHDWGRYGRSVCNVRIAGKEDLGLWLISNGHSPYVTRWGKNPYLHVEYTQAGSGRAN